MRKKSVTIADVARISGFSKTTVSFAFNFPNRISREAVDKIHAVANEIGYIPSPMARSLSQGKYYSIGLLLSNPSDTCFNNPYLSEILKGVVTVCENHGFNLTLIPPLNASVFDAVKSANVDGILTMGFPIDDEMIDILERRQLPVVSIDGCENENVLSVGNDDEKSAYVQMKAVMDSGHRKITIVSMKDNYYEEKYEGPMLSRSSRMMVGYEKALLEYGIDIKDVEVIETKRCFNDSRHVVFDYLASKSDDLPTCFVVMSDIAALGTMYACKEKGKNVPNDISIVSIDGCEVFRISGNGLSSIGHHITEKGRIATQLLFDKMNGKDVESVKVPFSEIEGSTLKKLC